MFRTFLLFLFSLCLCFNRAEAYNIVPEIYVGLVVNQFSTEVVSKVNYEVFLPESNETLKFEPGKIFISVKAEKLQIDGKVVNDNKLILRTDSDNNANDIFINRKNYRGKLEIILNDNRKNLTVLNIVPVEQYLAGLIAKGIPPLWPEEAIKAQTIAARTLAMNKIKQGLHEGFHVRANEFDQNYNGISGENELIGNIIQKTEGIVLTYQGQPIEAYFSDSNGGYSENSENVLGIYLPYLRGVKDYDKDSPNFKWQRSFTSAVLEKRLEQFGYKLGKLESIRLSPLVSTPNYEVEDRGISGRVLKMTFTGNAGTAEIAGEKLKEILQLDSTLFDIVVESPLPEFIDVPITDNFGNEINKKKIPLKIKNNESLGFLDGYENYRFISHEAEEKIIFNGSGVGNGLGLSMWGARGMALAAPDDTNDYYKTILTHYYNGITIEKIY